MAAAQQPFWSQWGRDAQHTGTADVAGQRLDRRLAQFIYDPLVSVAQAATGGDLLAHYQVPLLDHDDVYMEFKSGEYDRSSYSTQVWSEKKLSWIDGHLVEQWTFLSDWHPPGSISDFWEPVFQPALSGTFLYVPGQSGAIWKLNKSDGSVAARIDPFAMDSNTYVVSPLTVDGSGNVYYSVLQLGEGAFYSQDALDSWLVKVTPDDTARKVSYTVLTQGAPRPEDECIGSFEASELPWPPNPAATPPPVTCGQQRVAMNIAPAVAPDGTIYSITRPHFVSRGGRLVAVNSDLTPKWNSSLADRLLDGCGVPPSAGGVLPPNGAPGGCRAGAIYGVDPATNRPGDGRVLDSASSSPTVAPDGSVFYGAYTRYNYGQGHLMHFDAAGNYLGAFGFGWDTTPAIYPHDGTYSVVIKDNRYGGGSYCNNDTFCPGDRTATNPASPEQYFISQLNADLAVEWSYRNTNMLSCATDANGEIGCVADHPRGFEWCVNAPAIDANGTVYGTSEDGNVFAIRQGGTLLQRMFQQLTVGAAYTPIAIGSDGRIYSQNNGHLFVAGQ
jgi:hypothetical protein